MTRGASCLAFAWATTVLAAATNNPRLYVPPAVSESSSHANITAFVTRHLVLDLTADFDRHMLAGTAELHVIRRDTNATELVLDTRDLTIQRTEVADGTNGWAPVDFNLGQSTPIFGSSLHIFMPPGADRVRVTYVTSANSRALQWLTPAQTTGKHHPFLYTQAWAIQARSFIPLQDLPSVRITYDATIHTPRELVAVMAAESRPNEAGGGVFRFHMPEPIPSYLIALAIGDLTFKSIGARTGIWAEPSVLEAASREFADTERMISAAESTYGPYRWGRYDLLVMPPSFPFGGMENPRLTFASPTIIAGDKSLVSLVAHELAHSWSGNLVNNATWPDFWLNEGFTTYIERRIVEQLYGKARADMDRVIGLRRLQESRSTLKVALDKTLQPDFSGRDPDNAYSDVPYEQGALFLTFLETRYGRSDFDQFLRAWFDAYAFRSATTADFVAFLKTELMNKQPGVVTDDQIQTWLRSEDVPTFAVLPQSEAFAKVEGTRDAWLGGGSMDALASTSRSWSAQERIRFVDTLPRNLEQTQMSALDRQFGFTASHNAAIAQVWLRLAIATRYEPAYPALESYLLRIGRRRLIVPLYRDLAATAEGKARASQIFAKAREGYHAITQTAVEQALR
jgi:aminopeptidase N